MANKEVLEQKLREFPSYLQNGTGKLSELFDVSISTAKEIKDKLLQEGLGYTRPKNRAKDLMASIKKVSSILNTNKQFTGNTLIIPDLHIPFEHKEALNFCIKLRDKWNCTRFVFLGDLLDNHFSSFHDISTKAKGSVEELDLAKEAIKPWYKEFPNAYVCSSNHDSIPERKLEFGKLPSAWLRPINEVLEIPDWKFKDVWNFGNFICIHGMDGKVIKNKLLKYGGDKSIIQGHFHTNTRLEYYNESIYGLQLGALIDKDSYAFEYAKNNYRHSILSAAVILEDRTPIIELL